MCILPTKCVGCLGVLLLLLLLLLLSLVTPMECVQGGRPRTDNDVVIRLRTAQMGCVWGECGRARRRIRGWLDEWSVGRRQADKQGKSQLASESNMMGKK